MIAVNVPPLRDRRDDVPLLVDHFLARFREKNGKAVPAARAPRSTCSPSTTGRATCASSRTRSSARSCSPSRASIDVEDLPREVRGAPPLGVAARRRALTFEIGTPLEEIELRVIHETLRHTKGDKRLAAQLLGIATRTIYRKLDRRQAMDRQNDPESTATMTIWQWKRRLSASK